MIKANELRIGNKVIVRTAEYTGGRPTGAIITKEIEVFAIIKHPISAPDKRPVIMFRDGDRLNEHFLNENVAPIPLAPEWLERCGFVKKGISWRIDVNSSDELCLYHPENVLRYQTQGDGFTRGLRHIKYLHQLQNLYFALTGEELRIKK